MATNKTIENEGSVSDFVDTIADKGKRDDTRSLIEIFQSQTGFKPKMWGHAIIGFGSYHYKYESGREGDAPLSGFSPRTDTISLYFMNFEGREEMLSELGKHKTGKACVYIKKLEDVNEKILRNIITASAKYTKAKYS